MKKIFKNNKAYCIFIIVIALVYVVMISKEGIGIIYQYSITNLYKPTGPMMLVPQVIPHAHGILIDNLLIMIMFTCILIITFLIGRNKKVKLIVLTIFIIISTIFIPVYTTTECFDFNNTKNKFIIKTDKYDINTSPILNIFNL